MPLVWATQAETMAASGRFTWQEYLQDAIARDQLPVVMRNKKTVGKADFAQLRLAGLQVAGFQLPQASVLRLQIMIGNFRHSAASNPTTREISAVQPCEMGSRSLV